MAAHILPTNRVDVVTLNSYIKTVTEPCVRDYPILSGLAESKRFVFNYRGGQDGKAVSWPVHFRLPPVETNYGMKAVSPTRTPQHKMAELPCRSYRTVEAISKDEMLFNRGAPAIVSLSDRLVPSMTRALIQTIAKDLLNNDGASATSDYSERVHGLPSLFNSTGSVITDSPCWSPNGTYAGIVSTPGNYASSTWTPGTSNGWPIGIGDEAYAFWTPMIIDYEAAKFSGTSHTLALQWHMAFRFGITRLKALHNKRPDVIMCDGEMYRQILDSLEPHDQIVVKRDAGSSLMTRLGYETTSFEGVDLITGYGMPLNTAFMFPWSAFQLISWQSQLIEKETDDDFTVQAKAYSQDSWLNLKCETPAWVVEVTS
jgi:hypothetical protein